MNYIRLNFIILVSTIIGRLTIADSYDDEYRWAKDTMQNSCGDLIFAGMICRHGDRVQEKTYETDQHKNYQYQRGRGMLTAEGLNRTYDCGVYLRSRYEELCGKYFVDRIHIWESVNKPRCVESGINICNGLFPAYNDPLYKNWGGPDCVGHYYKPVYVRINETWDDKLAVYELTKDCPAYNEAVNNFWENNEDVKRFCDEYQGFYNHCLNTAAFPYAPCRSANGMTKMIIIWDTWKTQMENNLSQPYNFTNDGCVNCTIDGRKNFNATITRFLSITFQWPIEDPFIKKFQWGIMNQIFQHDMLIKNMSISGNESAGEINNNTQTTKCHMLSGQDLNIAAMMRGWGVWDNTTLIPYAACLSVEMRIKNGNTYVTTVLQNDTTKAPIPLHLNGCPDICCPFDTWSAIVTDSSLRNRTEACKTEDSTTTTTEEPNGTTRSQSTSTKKNRKAKKKEKKQKKRNSRTATTGTSAESNNTTTSQSDSSSEKKEKKRKKKKIKKHTTSTILTATGTSTVSSA